MAGRRRAIQEYPFDVVSFISSNKDLVKQYLKKNTYDIEVEDFDVDKPHFYQNNQNLKSARVEFEYSVLQKLEYIKCMKKIVYFTKKYVKIISIDEGIISFKPYKYQEKLLDLFQNKRFVIACQARQSGKTTVVASFLLHFSTFTPSKAIAILANKAAQAREIMARIQMSYESLPFFLKQGVSSYNKGSMKFGNYSEIFCGSTSSSSIRGRSISLLYLDEAAFVRNDMEFFESTYPTISSGKDSRVIITSTPNGARGLFHKIWTESVEGVNMFSHVAVPWNEVPGRDQEWRAEQIANTSQEQFDQEHGLKFRGSSNSLLAAHVLECLPVHKPVAVYGDLKVYNEPIADHQYFITVDTSRGVGGDFSALVVFDITTMPYEIAAVYKNNRISPMLYPQVVQTVGDKYNKAFVLIEINDIGEQVASIMYHDFEYENQLLCCTEKSTQKIGFVNDARLGVRTTVQVKSIGCSYIKTMIETNKLILKDEDVIGEFGTFIPKGRSYEAAEGAHDDLAMCCVLFAWASTQQYFIDLTDKDIRKNITDSLHDELMEDLLPFGFIDDGLDDQFGSYNERSVGTSWL